MSTTKLFRAGLIATIGVAGLTLEANAQSRYGDIYDYESGRNCGQACVPAAPVAAAPTTARYGAPIVAAPTYNPAPVYVDCVQAGTCAPAAPAVVYSQPTSFSSSTTYSEPTTSYSSGTTYSAPSTSMEPVSCPAGTTAQADGTCMQTGSSFSSSTTYSAPTTSYSSGTTWSAPSTSMEPVNCPAGTTAQADGTCMQGGSTSFAGSSVDLYTGDATTNTSSSYGYNSSSTYTASDYLLGFAARYIILRDALPPVKQLP